MSDMSAGQIVGGVVGAVVGWFVTYTPAGVAQGFALGAGIGGYIDPPAGPNLRGPTLNDKSFQSTAYGVSLPRLYGTIATMGNIIYLENNEYKAVSKKESQGGKGGGGGTYETTTYFATFAIALAEALPGSVVRRIWAGGKLIFSAGTNDYGTIVQSNKNSKGWKYYDGSQTEADSRMESVLGVGNCPSYEGTAYIIFYDFELTQYGNGLSGCPIKVEIVSVVDDSDKTGGGFIGYYDFSGVSDTNLLGSCSALKRNGESYQSSITWAYPAGATALAAGSVVNNFGLEDPIEFPVMGGYQDTDFSRNSIDGETNASTCWVRYRRNPPGADNDSWAATNGVVDYAFGEWDVRSVHEDEGTGLYFLQFKIDGGVTVYRLLSSYGNFIIVSSSALIAVGGGSVCVCRSGAIDVYNAELEFIRTLPNHLDIYGSRRGLTVFNNRLYVVGTINDFTLGLLRFSRVNLMDGSVVNHQVVMGESFQLLSAGFGACPTLTCVDGIFAYGNKFSKASAGPTSFCFIYFTSDAEMSTSDLAPSSALVGDIVAERLEYAGLYASEYDVSAINADRVFGYRFDSTISARAAIAPLQTAHLFDLVEIGYSIVAVKRGSSAVASVSNQSLMLDGGATYSSKIDTGYQYPSTYIVNYLDYNREYDTNSQSADYPSHFVNSRDVQLAIVMSENDAAKLADILINLAHVEAKIFSFRLPQSYLSLVVSDVIDVEFSPGVITKIRADNVTKSADQTLTVSGRRAQQDVYQSAAIGAPTSPPSETIPLISASTAVLLDIPMIINDFDYPGFVSAMYGIGTWPGGVLFRSTDNGQTYTPIQSFYGLPTVGVAKTILIENGGAVIDRNSYIEIDVVCGEFFSITETQMMTGQHYLAYGLPGRWEIMQYAISEPISEKGVRLSVLVRGMRGTEWATGLHGMNDIVVLLDDPDNQFIGTDLSQFMMERLYKAGTIGANVQDAQSFSFTYEAVNLKPLSPINCEGIVVDLDWHVEFVLRTRYQGSYWKSGLQPQNEPVISIEVEIYSSLTVVRRLTLSTPQFIYTEEQQIEDFGSVVSSLSLKIYQISAAVGRGFPLEVTL